MEPRTWTDWADFLANAPPGTRAHFPRQLFAYRRSPNVYSQIRCPNLQLFCANESCNGYLWYETMSDPSVSELAFLTYTCRNCKGTKKVYALKIVGDDQCEVTKLGEDPPFGPPVPSRVISLIGPDRDSFLKGRRSENQGLGIGAFAYYRRVVEAQKNRLLDAIIAIAKAEQPAPDLIAQLEAAKVETQFSKAIDSIKPGIPDALKINGHNPLTLLHGALSQGIHAQTDAECLQIATAIRTVLTALAERMEEIKKDQTEVRQAVSILQQKTAAKKSS
jgi:hypothetical protein